MLGESTIVPRKERPAKKQERLRQTTKELEEQHRLYRLEAEIHYDEVLSSECIRMLGNNYIRTENEVDK